MRIVVLTTQTPHHTFFVKRLCGLAGVELVVTEDKPLTAPFETRHPFEDRRDEYEKRIFFNGDDVLLEDIAEVYHADRAGDPESLARIGRVDPQLVIVFGTARLPRQVIDLCPEGIVNLHGGDPERYRGLDSHLWSIYHNDFASMKVTLHRVNDRLDDGDIIVRRPLTLLPDMKLPHLRRHNTELCVALVSAALQGFDRDGCFRCRPQCSRGRYYSFMPSPLKGMCKDKFEAHTRGL